MEASLGTGRNPEKASLRKCADAPVENWSLEPPLDKVVMNVGLVRESDQNIYIEKILYLTQARLPDTV